jgi:hypothetical protein
MPEHGGDEFAAAADTELAECCGQVFLNGIGRYVQFPDDLAGGVSPEDQGDDTLSPSVKLSATWLEVELACWVSAACPARLWLASPGAVGEPVCNGSGFRSSVR